MTDSLDANVVEQYRGLVQRLATDLKRRYRLGVELDELVSAGLEGLVQAHQAYDPDRGVSFSSFAYYRIKGAILDNCRRLGVMRRQYERRSRFEESANEVLADAAEREPPSNDSKGASRWIGSTFDTLAAAYRLSEVQERSERRESIGPEKKVVRRRMSERLEQQLGQLSDEERDVIESYYFRDEAMGSIAKRYGVSKSWVSRVHTRTLRKLRPLLDESGSG